MKISFFEEFPKEKVFKKLDLIDFNTKLYVADCSIEGFKMWKKRFGGGNIKEWIYWPVVNVSDGYWFSPWMKRKAMLRSFTELLKYKGGILYDAEFPKNRWLLFNCQFFKNRKLIDGFFKKFKGEIYTAEYFFMQGILRNMAKFFRLEFEPSKKGNYVIKMMYSSMLKAPRSVKEKIIRKGISEYGDKFLVGLGCLDVGINKNEKIISVSQLRADLELCSSLNVKEVVLFRLSGLNKNYLSVLKEFSS